MPITAADNTTNVNVSSPIILFFSSVAKDSIHKVYWERTSTCAVKNKSEFKANVELVAEQASVSNDRQDKHVQG